MAEAGTLSLCVAVAPKVEREQADGPTEVTRTAVSSRVSIHTHTHTHTHTRVQHLHVSLILQVANE